MSMRAAIFGILLVVAGVVVASLAFVVDQREQVVVLQFGEPVRTIQEPGLKFKLPWPIQEVRRFERRVLNVDPPVEQVILADQRRLDVDVFGRYRITNPQLFLESVNNEGTARQRLSTFMIASLREVLGNATQVEVLSDARAGIMDSIREAVDARAAALGIDIVDVRIVRADVPEDTVQSVFDRMRSEREREAREFRAQGQELSQQIRARADRERTVLLAEAERESEILRGEGDEEAIRIRGEAFSQDEEFYSFYRALEAYRGSFNPDDTTLVLSPNSEFFRYFNEGPPTAGSR